MSGAPRSAVRRRHFYGVASVCLLPVCLLPYSLPSRARIMMQVETRNSHFFYSCCPEYYPTMKYTVYLRRFPLFYAAGVIVPLAMLTYSAFLSFIVNPDSGERIGLVVTDLLAIVAICAFTFGFSHICKLEKRCTAEKPRLTLSVIVFSLPPGTARRHCRGRVDSESKRVLHLVGAVCRLYCVQCLDHVRRNHQRVAL